MNSDELAGFIAESIARHETRGLVDTAAGIDDVVIHGRTNLRSVAQDVLAALSRQERPARRSWSPWFADAIDARHGQHRLEERRRSLAERLDGEPGVVDAALARLRLRGAGDEALAQDGGQSS